MTVQPRIFKIGDHTYKAGRLSTFDQMELAMTCRQAFFNLALLEMDNERGNRPTDDRSYAQAFCGMFGQLPKDVRDGAIQICLSVVARARGKNNELWDPALQGDQFMFSDMEGPDVFKLLYEVVKHNGLIRFFAVSLVSGEKDETTANSQS